MSDLSVGKQPVNITLQAEMEAAADTTSELKGEQASSQESFMDALERNTASLRTTKSSKEIKDEAKEAIKKAQKAENEEVQIVPVEEVESQAQNFNKKNRELETNTLLILHNQIKPNDSKEAILNKIKAHYPDPSLADEAIDFLLLTTKGELHEKLSEIKQEMYQSQGREIRAGRNIEVQARVAADNGLGTATQMRELYRDITGNPRDASTLCSQFMKTYDFKSMKRLVDFLLHSLGADLKSKGPSIEPGLLHRLITETRSLQAIVGVYRFFRQNMRLVNSQFAKYGIPVPTNLNFENLAKQFVSFVGDRYPSPDKLGQKAQPLGISGDLRAEIITFQLFRDFMKQVPDQLLASPTSRPESTEAILTYLEAKEDEIDEQMELETANELEDTDVEDEEITQ